MQAVLGLNRDREGGIDGTKGGSCIEGTGLGPCGCEKGLRKEMR